MWATWVQALGWEYPLEKGTATHQYSDPGEFHGLYSPWSYKEPDKEFPKYLRCLVNSHIPLCGKNNNLARVYMVGLMNSWVLFCFLSVSAGDDLTWEVLNIRGVTHSYSRENLLFCYFPFKWGIFCKVMATYCNILGWKFPWTKNPDKLQSMGSQRVRHDWVTKCTHRFMQSSAHKPEPMDKSVCKCGYMSVYEGMYMVLGSLAIFHSVI